MSTPRCGREVTQEWLQDILTQYEDRHNPGASVQVTAFEVKPGAKKGENFGSEVVKIRVEGQVTGVHDSYPTAATTTTISDTTTTPTAATIDDTTSINTSDTITTTLTAPNPTTTNTTSITDPTTTTINTTITATTYHLFAKFLHGSSAEQEFLKVLKGHLRELLSYSDVIAQLNKYQAKNADDRYRINIPKYVYGICTDDDYALVMEDLAPEGYSTENKMKGLDLPHILTAVEGLARLHAVSLAFSQTHDFMQTYPAFITEYNFNDMFYKGTSSFLCDEIIKTMGQKQGEHDHIIVKLKANRTAFLQRLANSLKDTEDTKVQCLNHGDFWTNNIMFLNKDSQTHEMMMIDWGMTQWRNPVLDVQYFIYNSMSLSLRKAHLQKILKHYHSTFTEIVNHFGVTVTGWEFEDFLKEWQRTRPFGTCLGLVNALMTMSLSASQIDKTTGERPSRVTTWITRTIAPWILALFCHPWMEFIPRNSMRESFQPMLQELASGSNEPLTARVFDLLVEADEEGLLEP